MSLFVFVLVSLFSFPAPAPDCPLWMRRRAQVQADQGSRCLSEASLARPRLNRAPQVARSEAEGRSNQGRLFLLTFFGEAKKVSRMPGNPGQQVLEEGEARKPAQDPA